ncbi:MAG: pentapeptide repeat-containing protein [Microcystaceae cyanobacterium]
MINVPNLTIHGYQVIRELGYNSEGGRTTYLAKDLKTEQEVVIKAFYFMKQFMEESMQEETDWTGYKAHEREIEVLQQLNHPRIPRYLDSFETDNGFCLVQEYKNAPSLAEQSGFTPENVKKIAISVLEILVDLQTRREPVFHRDIKPENILVDAVLNAYLIDFGLARIEHNNSMVASSWMGGTLGFMSFEQIFDSGKHKVNKSSDLYSFGMTLICLLTETKSNDISELITPNGVDFDKVKKKLPPLHTNFVKWLNKMVEWNTKERFSDAKLALNKLKSIRVEGLSFMENVSNGLSFIGNNKEWVMIPLVVIIGGIFMTYGAKQIRLEQEKIANKQRLEHIRNAYIQMLEEDRNAYIQMLEDKRIAEEEKLKEERIAQEKKLKEERIAQEKKLKAIREKNRQTLFRGKKCPNCNLEGVDLQSANLEETNLQGANLKEATLQGANLEEATLQDANLQGANLESNIYSRYIVTRLKKANLKKANLEDANLEDANLRGANLEDANLQGANLQGANLEGIKLSSHTDFTGAIMPDGTVYEEWLKRQ